VSEAIDARVAYEMWIELIANEPLYEAMIAGTHRDLATSLELDEVKLSVLDALRAERGTRWNIENLRFRTAYECGGTLTSYLPRTIKLLTNGDENWLQDITFEYLSSFRWKEHGHHRFAECERFATYVRDRIMKRRITPRYLDEVLEFELEVIRLLRDTAQVPLEAWPKPQVLDDAQLLASRIQRAPAVRTIDLAVDLTEWVESADPTKGVVRERPVTYLVYVPSLQDTHRIKLLGEGPKIVLACFDGSRTTEEIATALEEEYGIERAELVGLVRNWLTERVLVVI
jgi:hypothetical protein